MSVEKVTFKMGGLLQVLPDLDTVNGRVFPISPNADVPNTALSCHENLVNYQVPVGKKALVIGVQAFDGSTARPVRIFYNPSADTTNGSDVDITTIYTLGTAAQMPAPSEFAGSDVSIPASQFITCISSAGTGGGFFTVWVLEQDA